MAVQAPLYAESNLVGFPLGGPQDSLMMDNSDYCFNLQQQQKLQQQQPFMQYQQLQMNMQQRHPNFCFYNNLLDGNGGDHKRSMEFSEGLASQIKKQRVDVDRLICLQNEKLRLVLQEQRKQQVALLLKECESKAQILLRQKDEAIAKAVNRRMELEDFIRKMETENQTWQRVAKENEAIIMSLNTIIEQLKESACQQSGNGAAAEDAESCCDVMEKRAEGGGLVQENGEQMTRKMMCKSCNSWNSCVILLPCRHLCSCNACEAYIDTCPVCKMVKTGSIEALI